MGREIRRVPPNWEHPRFTEGDARRREDIGEYRSCYDKDYATACRDWKEGFAQWEAGTHEGQTGKFPSSAVEFWEYDGGPPEEESYRPAFTEDPTWFQVYQTVSEGTPVTPPFATTGELIDYLVENGDFWCQQRTGGLHHEGPPSREAATAFVEIGSAPSMVMFRGPEGVSIKTGINAAK